jgi:hypothetical protein
MKLKYNNEILKIYAIKPRATSLADLPSKG